MSSGQPGVSATSSATVKNIINGFAVVMPPEDSISALEFSPASLQQQDYLIAGSWDNSVRCWQVEPTGNTVPKAMKTLGGPVLDVCWSDDGSKVFMASVDNQVNMWDLVSDQLLQVAAHDAPVRTCHWVKAPNYSCLMTGSWDKTLKFWDTRTPHPLLAINLPERVYCADVMYPMAVVGTAAREILIYSLENGPSEFKRQQTTLKQQLRAIAIFKDKGELLPTGYALASTEGRVAVQYVHSTAKKVDFTFKCHRSMSTRGFLNIYAINDVAYHPVHNTVATVGSDGCYSFWDQNKRTKLVPTSDPMEQSITKCCFNANGKIFAYAVSYDWSQGHDHVETSKKPAIFLYDCFEDLKPKSY